MTRSPWPRYRLLGVAILAIVLAAGLVVTLASTVAPDSPAGPYPQPSEPALPTAAPTEPSRPRVPAPHPNAAVNLAQYQLHHTYADEIRANILEHHRNNPASSDDPAHSSADITHPQPATVTVSGPRPAGVLAEQLTVTADGDTACVTTPRRHLPDNVRVIGPTVSAGPCAPGAPLMTPG